MIVCRAIEIITPTFIRKRPEKWNLLMLILLTILGFQNLLTLIFFCLWHWLAHFFSCKKIIHPRKSCRTISRVRTVSCLKTFFVRFLLTQLTAWTGSPYRNGRLNIGEHGKRDNEGRNGYPFPLNIPSWSFLPLPIT